MMWYSTAAAHHLQQAASSFHHVGSNRFMGIAEQMGRVLQRTSISVNIKERLDFSCALFDAHGGPPGPAFLPALCLIVIVHACHAAELARLLCSRVALLPDARLGLSLMCMRACLPRLSRPAGNLVSNAPHLPVHLGAMSEAVKFQIQHYCSGGAGAVDGLQVRLRWGQLT
jgi:hypothetical protein